MNLSQPATGASPIDGPVAKIIASILVVVCLAVGLVGLVLPVIPGLLFVGIALIIIARRFPSLDRGLRRNPTLAKYLDRAHRFADLDWPGRLRYGLLLCLRFLVDVADAMLGAVRRLIARNDRGR